MDEQLSRQRADAQDKAGAGQDVTSGQVGALPDPQGTIPAQQSEAGKPAANAAESGPADQFTGEGTGARAGEYS